jgi:hypothetical protein
MNTKQAVQSLPEYVTVPLAELVESSTNPRKTFDDERLDELAESIRSKGVLSPLLARQVNGHFEIVSGAGLLEVPVRIVAPNDAEAQGFYALLEREGPRTRSRRSRRKPTHDATSEHPEYSGNRFGRVAKRLVGRPQFRLVARG